MRKGWDPDWRDGPPWSQGRDWWTQRPGSETWQTFGRKMAKRFFVAMFAFLTFLVASGAFIATVVVGAGSVQRWVVVGLAPAILVVVVVLAVRYVRRTWLPVRDLIGAAGSLADGDYTARVEPNGSAAIRPVARSFNDMARRLETADEERRRLLADLGHEIRTPLTVVRGEIEAMLDGVHEPDPDHLELLLEEVSVMERLIEDLRTLSLAEAGALALHPEPTDLADLIGDVIDGQRRSATAAAVRIDLRVAPQMPEMMLDPVRIREVLANLVINAIRAMRNGGVLTVTATLLAGSAVVEIADSGVGIEPDELERVFDRFRKGSDSQGSGLGLTISRDLVEAHQGTIEMTSRPGFGTTVVVTLPIIEIPG